MNADIIDRQELTNVIDLLDPKLSQRVRKQIDRTQEISVISEERIVYSRYALENLYQFLEDIQ